MWTNVSLRAARGLSICNVRDAPYSCVTGSDQDLVLFSAFITTRQLSDYNSDQNMVVDITHCGIENNMS